MAHIIPQDQITPDLDYEKGLDIRIGINDTTCGSKELTMGYTIIPPGVRNPAHFHPNAEAGFFILKGELNIYLGENRDLTVVKVGSFVHIPKGEIHGLENTSLDESAALIFAYGNVPNKEASGTTFVEEPWVK